MWQLLGLWSSFSSWANIVGFTMFKWRDCLWNNGGRMCQKKWVLVSSAHQFTKITYERTLLGCVAASIKLVHRDEIGKRSSHTLSLSHTHTHTHTHTHVLVAKSSDWTIWGWVKPTSIWIHKGMPWFIHSADRESRGSITHTSLFVYHNIVASISYSVITDSWRSSGSMSLTDGVYIVCTETGSLT